MSTHLPEDPSNWPRDPFALLGVRMPLTPKDLKRAYVKLIRQYKPEHHPEEFRRIRDAYEQVEKLLSSVTEAPLPEFPEPVESAAEEKPSDFLSSIGKRLAQRTFRPARPDLNDQLDEYWELARQGELQRAYDKIRALEQQHLGDTDLCHRLFWLLKVAPELDPQRSPSAWLLHGIHHAGGHSSLLHLYRREIIAQPAEAVSESCQQVLQKLHAPGAIRDLIDWRWQAIWSEPEGRQQIAADLNLFRGSIRDRDEEAWARILMLAADFLAWSDEEEVLELWYQVCDEILEYDYLADRLAEEFYRLDFLKELAEEWRACHLSGKAEQHAVLLELIPVSWIRPVEVYKPQLMALLQRVSQVPQRSLWALDRLREQAPLVVGQFYLILRYFEHLVPDDSKLGGQSDLVDRLVWRMLNATWRLGYMQWREELLKFTTEEFVSVYQLEDAMTRIPAASISPDQAYLIQHRIEALYEDCALRAVSLAHRLFFN